MEHNPQTDIETTYFPINFLLINKRHASSVINVRQQIQKLIIESNWPNNKIRQQNYINNKNYYRKIITSNKQLVIARQKGILTVVLEEWSKIKVMSFRSRHEKQEWNEVFRKTYNNQKAESQENILFWAKHTL